MSIEYNYYAGFLGENNEIKLLGPYDAKGTLIPIYWASQSYASDLHNLFHFCSREQLQNTKWRDNESSQLLFLRVREMPNGSPITKGYFPINEVRDYERYQDDDTFNDLKFSKISEEVYRGMERKELRFGRPAPRKDAEGGEYTPLAASDYMYYSFLDRQSKEYESEIIYNMAQNLALFSGIDEDDIIIVLEIC